MATPTATSLPTSTPFPALDGKLPTPMDVIGGVFQSTRFATNFVLLSQLCFIGWAMVSCAKHCKGAFWKVLLMTSLISFLAALLNAIQWTFLRGRVLDARHRTTMAVIGICAEPLYAFTEFGVAAATYVRMYERVTAATQSRRYQRFLFVTFGLPLFASSVAYLTVRLRFAFDQFSSKQEVGAEMTAPSVGCQGQAQCAIIGATYIYCMVPVLAVLFKARFMNFRFPIIIVLWTLQEMQECRCVLKFSVGKSIGYPLLTSTFAALMTVDLSYAYLALSNVSSTGAAEGGLFQKLQTPSLLFKAFFPFILAFDDMIQKLVRAPSPCEQLLLENAAAAAAEAATQQEKQGAKFNNYGTGIPKISIEGPSAEALRKNPSWYLDANQKQKLNVSGVYQEFTQAWGNQDPNGPPNGNPNISPEAAMQALYANAAYNNDQNVPPAFNEALGIVVEDKNRTLRVPGTHPSGTVPSLQRRGISVCSGGESAGGTMSRALDSHLFTISRYSENYDPLKRRVSGLHPGSFRSSFNSEMPMSPGIVSPRTPRSPGA